MTNDNIVELLFFILFPSIMLFGIFKLIYIKIKINKLDREFNAYVKTVIEGKPPNTVTYILDE